MTRVELHRCVVCIGSLALLLLAVGIPSTVAFQVAPTTCKIVTVPTTTTSVLLDNTVSPFLKSRPTARVQQPQLSRSLPLYASTNDNGSSVANGEVDFDALIKYHASIVLQMGILFSLLTGLDYVVSSVLATDDAVTVVPFWATCILFFGMSLKSRTFNPLDNTRPDLSSIIEGQDPKSDSSSGSTKGFGDRVMPSWTPPGIIFPIMWVLIIGPTRAYTASLVYASTGHFADPAILALFFHLAVGDVWNTINNTEKRFGAAVTGVLCVSLANANAALQFYRVDETAGTILGATMVWFAVASALIVQTWRLNPVDGTTGELDKVYPVVGGGDVETRFAWFGGGSD